MFAPTTAMLIIAVDKFPHTKRGIRRTSYPLVPCGDSRVDVKGKIGIAVKRLEIKGFKTKGSIFECCFWSFFFLSVETYRKAENGRVVATLLI